MIGVGVFNGYRVWCWPFWREVLSPFTYWRAAKQFLQRGWRGWADSDTWDLCGYLAQVVPPALEHMKATTPGYPGITGAETPEEWDARLDEMIAGFRAAYVVHDEPPDRFFVADASQPLGLAIPDIDGLHKWQDEQTEVWKKGAATFIEWYFHLWT